MGSETRYRLSVTLRIPTRAAATLPAAVLALIGSLASLPACAGAPAAAGPHPPRAEGCEVTVYADAPPVTTESIGVVSATCGDDVSDADCLRTLKDQACKLGADVVWGVPDKPKLDLGKKKLSGRAVHTVAPAPPAGAAPGAGSPKS